MKILNIKKNEVLDILKENEKFEKQQIILISEKLSIETLKKMLRDFESDKENQESSSRKI